MPELHQNRLKSLMHMKKQMSMEIFVFS